MKQKNGIDFLSPAQQESLEKVTMEFFPLLIWFNSHMKQFDTEEERYDKVRAYIKARLELETQTGLTGIADELLSDFNQAHYLFDEILVDFSNYYDVLAEVDKEAVILIDLIANKKHLKHADSNIEKLAKLYAPVCIKLRQLKQRCDLISPVLEKVEKQIQIQTN